MPRALAPFQVEALGFLGQTGRAIYGDPPGSRKTATSLTLAAGRPGRTLIVTPANVLHHWVHEAQDAVPDWPLAWYRGSDSAKRRTPAVDSWLQRGGALITNYEAVRRDVDWLLKAKIRNLVFDEAHRLKNRTSQISRAVSRLSTASTTFLAVTGTPVMNRAEELWALLHLIDRHRWPAYWPWAEEHFYVKSTTFGKATRFPVRIVGAIRPGHEKILQQEMLGLLLYRPIEDLMPELGSEPIWTNLAVALAPAERKVYNQMAEHGWVEADNDEGFISADLAIARQGRLRQLVSGWADVQPEDGLTSKAKAAVELVGDLDEPAVVLTANQETAHRIAAKIPGSVVYTGRLKQEDRDRNKDRFAEGKASAIVGTIAALGVGVDGLQRNARNLIFVDLDWVYDVNRQAVGRLWRSGQTRPVNVWALTAEDTIDEVVAEANRQQKDVKELLLGATWQDLVRGRWHDHSPMAEAATP